MKLRSRTFSIWPGSIALVLLLAGRTDASPIFSLSLSDGTKSAGADIVSFNLTASGGTFVEVIDTLTPLLVADVTTGKYFDWAVITAYDGGSALSPGNKTGEYDFTKVLFTSWSLALGKPLLLADAFTIAAGTSTYIPVEKNKEPKPFDTPEPTTLALVGIGFALLLLAQPRRKRIPNIKK